MSRGDELTGRLVEELARSVAGTHQARTVVLARGQTGPAALAAGVDVVDVPRLRELGLRWGDDLLARLFSDEERRVCAGASDRYRWYSLAGRLAAKEAIKKVLGSAGERAGWREVEVHRGLWGEPALVLHGSARDGAARAGFTDIHLSIAHEAAVSLAVAIAV